MESKKAKHIETESRRVVARDWGWSKWGDWPNGKKKFNIRLISSGDII